MKKEALHHIDEYFRQHEAEVPIVFDQAHWQQLSAALDAAHSRPQAPAPTAPTKWQTTHLWITATLAGLLILAIYLLLQGPNPAPTPQATPPAPATSNSPEPPRDSLAETQNRRDQTDRQTKGQLETPASFVPASGAGAPAPSGEKMPLAKDSVNQRPVLQPMVPPADSSTAQPTTPIKKKKKHLFW